MRGSPSTSIPHGSKAWTVPTPPQRGWGPHQWGCTPPSSPLPKVPPTTRLPTLHWQPLPDLPQRNWPSPWAAGTLQADSRHSSPRLPATSPRPRGSHMTSSPPSQGCRPGTPSGWVQPPPPSHRLGRPEGMLKGPRSRLPPSLRTAQADNPLQRALRADLPSIPAPTLGEHGSPSAPRLCWAVGKMTSVSAGGWGPGSCLLPG